MGMAFTMALVGRRDQPTDAVEDYCRLLGAAFEERGFSFAFKRVPWNELGWLKALRNLWRDCAAWKGNWVLVQYTALMWSRRGFPFYFLLVLFTLKVRRVHIAVVFHDSEPYGGRQIVDKIRRVCQRMVMRRACLRSDAAILTIPVEEARWVPKSGTRCGFIAVGANIPAAGQRRDGRNGHNVRTIAVFSVTDGGNIAREVGDIAGVAKRVAQRRSWEVRLVTVGRGSRESEGLFRDFLAGSQVNFSALGILPASEVSQVLARSDVALFVRSPLTTQRGSAIAAIASAVPLVTYAKPTLSKPLAAAGVIPVPYRDAEKLAEATVRVLTDPPLWRDLHERSRRAYEQYFSWDAIARRYLEVLHRP